MKETKLAIGPSCHLELLEWNNLAPTLSLDYVEHCPIAGGSDTDTSIDITKEKAREIISFLLPFAFNGEAGMYSAAEDAYPKVKVGDFTICRQNNKSVWIQCVDGEGAQFSDAAFEKAIAEFYTREF